MAFTPDFTVTQGINPSSFSITDASVGSDDNIIGRQITLIQADGIPLKYQGQSIVDWGLDAGSTIELINILDRDYCLFIQVDWLVPDGEGDSYQSSKLYLFTRFSELFSYSLTQYQASKPNIINDTNWFYNRTKLLVYIDSSKQAWANEDQYNSQYNLDMATEMNTNSSIYF